MMFLCFFFNDTATTEIYTLSLHDALPISLQGGLARPGDRFGASQRAVPRGRVPRRRGAAYAAAGSGVSADRSGDELDRKSTRLNSSHLVISYAVFCLKKKKTILIHHNSESSPTPSLLVLAGPNAATHTIFFNLRQHVASTATNFSYSRHPELSQTPSA